MDFTCASAAGTKVCVVPWGSVVLVDVLVLVEVLVLVDVLVLVEVLVLVDVLVVVGGGGPPNGS